MIDAMRQIRLIKILQCRCLTDLCHHLLWQIHKIEYDSLHMPTMCSMQKRVYFIAIRWWSVCHWINACSTKTKTKTKQMCIHRERKKIRFRRTIILNRNLSETVIDRHINIAMRHHTTFRQSAVILSRIAISLITCDKWKHFAKMIWVLAIMKQWEW